MSQFRHAFKLSKEEVRIATPPGTKVLTDHDLETIEHGQHGHHAHLHLHPPPSQDPLDPLNLPLWRKITITLLMGLFAFLAVGSSSIISSALPTLITAFATFPQYGPPSGILDFASLTQLLAVNNLMLGAANIWWVPLSNIYGRRVIILVCLFLFTVFSIWCAVSQSFNSLLAARIFQGIGGATAETLAPDIIGRIWFVHQGGRAMAVYTVLLSLGSIIGGLIGGYVTSGINWRWTFYFPAIMGGILFILCALLLPETLFDRDAALAGLAQYRRQHSVAHSDKEIKEEVEDLDKLDLRGTVTRSERPTMSFAQTLAFPRPRKWTLAVWAGPILAIRLPGTQMVALQYAGLIGLIVSASTVAPQILSAPPFLWGSGAGLINVGGIIGTGLGLVVAYLLTDFVTKRQAAKNLNGYAEPEERLPLMIPALILTVAGSLAFGFSGDAHTPNSWIGLEFGYGMICFGLMFVPSVGFNYLIESYGSWASDCFVGVVVFRAIIAFAWTFFVGTWVQQSGNAIPFGVFAAIMAVFALTVFPVWLMGKRLRIATAGWVHHRTS